MQISDESKLLFNNINENLERPVKNNYEVSLIINFVYKLKDDKVFNDLIFKAKYVNGLKNVLSNRIVTGDDFMGKIFAEFNKNLQEFSDILKNIVNESDDFQIKDHFKNKYFDLKHENVANTLDLIEDLTLIKEYFNLSSEKLFKRLKS